MPTLKELHRSKSIFVVLSLNNKRVTASTYIQALRGHNKIFGGSRFCRSTGCI